MLNRRFETVPSRKPEEREVGNRKLIRASLSDVQGQMNSRCGTRNKRPPSEQTNAKNFYYLKQMQARAPMAVVLASGEALQGMIEWHNTRCVKINRVDEPNLLVMKSAIRYVYKG
jgi:host factor-I protein